MKKRILSLLLAALLCLSLLPVTALAAEAEPARGGSRITVFFIDTLNWGTPNIYYWSGGPEWPGTPMTLYGTNSSGQKVYKAEIPADVNGLLFNTGDTMQTDDITNDIANGSAWYPTGSYLGNRYAVEMIYIDPNPSSFLDCSSGSATGYFSYIDHFYKVEWSGINTSQTSSVMLNINTTDNRLEVSTNGNALSASVLYAGADSNNVWSLSAITGLTPGQSSSGYTDLSALAAGAGASSKKKVCTVTCAAAGGPVWNWSSDYSSCTATFTCTADPALTVMLSAAVTQTPSQYTASVTFNGAAYTDTKPIYTVSFLANGHGTAPASQKVVSGDRATRPDDLWGANGHSFTGWCTDAGCETEFDFDTPITGDLTLYAWWTLVEFDIRYDLNGGALSTDKYSYTIESPDITLDTPTRTGYSFAGWYDHNNPNGDAVTVIPTGSYGKLWLFARWTPYSYTVVFDGNGATGGSMSGQHFSYDEYKALTLNAFARTGHTFAGWNTRSDGSGTAYADAGRVSNLTAGDGETVTLHAIWRANVYTVVFDGGAPDVSGEMASQAFTYDESQKLSACTFARKGYDFMGWSAPQRTAAPSIKTSRA